MRYTVNFSRSRMRLFFFLWLCASAASLSCGSPPTDPRTVIPSDALVYLETKDLGKAVGAITGNKAFTELAVKRPDLSVLNRIAVAVAVTGFETTEQAVTDENSILSFQPRFVAVAETGLWNYQAIRLTENEIGSFVNETYGGEVVADISDRPDGKYYVWTSPVGKKAFALVQGSVIYFGNDESAIDKCLAVKRGEADSIAKNPKIIDGERLAFGYVSPDGIAQIANIAGISLAMQASEEGEVKNFIARVLPEILRNSLKEMTWTATKTEQGIEDKFNISTEREVAAVFNETIVPASVADGASEYYLPPNAQSVTRYDLRDPQIAWRSVLLTTRRLTEQFNGNLLVSFSGSLFEPYGINDAELFLSAVGPVIHTVRYETDSDRAIVVATSKDFEKIKRSAAGEINISKPAEKLENAEIWKSDDGETALIFTDGTVVIGDAETAAQFLQWRQQQDALSSKHPLFDSFSASDAVAVTASTDQESAAKIVDIFSERKNANESVKLRYLTETRFNQNGIERRTTSDFGLIGSIIAQFGGQ